MSHDICPDTGEPCTCDGSEPCACGCGGCGHTAEEEAAAAAYRETHREGPPGDDLDHERKIIVSFDTPQRCLSPMWWFETYGRNSLETRDLHVMCSKTLLPAS